MTAGEALRDVLATRAMFDAPGIGFGELMQLLPGHKPPTVASAIRMLCGIGLISWQQVGSRRFYVWGRG